MWVATTNSPEDLHLLSIAHAGRTKQRANLRPGDGPSTPFYGQVWLEPSSKLLEEHRDTGELHKAEETGDVALPGARGVVASTGARQRRDRRASGVHIAGGGGYPMDRLGSAVHANMGLHATIPLVPLLLLMHL